jgi:hypothetical protein
MSLTLATLTDVSVKVTVNAAPALPLANAPNVNKPSIVAVVTPPVRPASAPTVA